MCGIAGFVHRNRQASSNDIRSMCDAIVHRGPDDEGVHVDGPCAIGMRRRQVMRHVILPQAVKRMIPPFMNQSIIQLKNTSLVSTIAVADLLYEGTIITAATYRPLEVYTMVAAVYFLVLFPLTLAAQQVERLLARAD